MIFEEPYKGNKLTKKKLIEKVDWTVGTMVYIYATLSKRCQAIYVGQRMTPFKDWWNKHVMIGRNTGKQERWNYISVHPDAIDVCHEISVAWKVTFFEEPSFYLLDTKKKHRRDMFEIKSSFVNLQRMVLLCVKWERKNILDPMFTRWGP